MGILERKVCFKMLPTTLHVKIYIYVNLCVCVNCGGFLVSR